MNDKVRWLQLVALLPLSVAAVPLLINQCSQINTREALEKQAAQHATLGQQAEEAKDLALATQAYSDAVTADPEEPRYQKLLERAYIKQILADAGVISPNNALSLHTRLARAVTQTKDPDAELLMAFGRLLQYRNMPEQARARFKQATEKAPKNAMAHLLLGDALLKAGSFEAAAVSLETSIELEPTALARFALGQVRLSQDRHEDALPLLEEASKSLPNANVFLALGLTYEKLKKTKKAERALVQALGLNQRTPGLQRALADVYAANGKIELAEAAYGKAFDESGDLENLRRLARIYRDTNRPAEAAQVFNKIRIVEPTDAEAHCNIAIHAEIQKDVMTANAAYTKCIEYGTGKADMQKMVEMAKERTEILGKIIQQAKQAEEEAKAEAEKKKGARKKK